MTHYALYAICGSCGAQYTAGSWFLGSEVKENNAQRKTQY